MPVPLPLPYPWRIAGVLQLLLLRGPFRGDFGGPDGGMVLERLVQGVADEDLHPGHLGHGEEVNLQQGQFPGHEQGKKLVREGKGDQVGFGHRTQGGGHPFLQHAFAPHVAARLLEVVASELAT